MYKRQADYHGAAGDKPRYLEGALRVVEDYNRLRKLYMNLVGQGGAARCV